MANLNEVFFDQDESCHWYMIPAILHDQWNEMQCSIEDADEYGNEAEIALFYEAVADFEQVFGRYRTDFDPRRWFFAEEGMRLIDG